MELSISNLKAVNTEHRVQTFRILSRSADDRFLFTALTQFP
jgi:hypothetical protein